VTQLLKPPINYVIIVVVVGIMIAKQMYKKKDEKTSLQDPVNQNDIDVESPTKIQELDKIERDNEYSKHEEGKFSETEESKNTEKDQK
ncbi:MAG: signal peptidase I, partial [Nitrosarchaeum sp.]